MEGREGGIEGLYPAASDLPLASCQYLEQRQCLLSPFESVDILKDDLGLSVMGNDEGSLVAGEVSDKTRGVCFEIADWFYGTAKLHRFSLISVDHNIGCILVDRNIAQVEQTIKTCGRPRHITCR